MNLFLEAFAWLFAPDQFSGPGSIPQRIGEHLFYTVIAFGIAVVIAVPAGYAIAHTGRGRQWAVALSGAARALPSFGLILLLVMIVGVLQVPLAVVIAFVLLAIPSILAGAYAGIEAIDRATVDAARALGMSEWQILVRVEAPLGLPLLIAGMRSGVLQIVATATLAAYVGLGGLGYGIIQGLALRRFDQMLGTALVIVALALLIDSAFGALQHLTSPRGVRTPSGPPRSRGMRAGEPAASAAS